MSTSPGDQDSDAAAEGEGADAESNAGGEQGGADAGAGGERKEATKGQDDEVIEFGMGDTAEDDDIAPLSLLAQGDSLPLSYRSDNGTRESEFFVGDDNEHINPYYDVVRRLSPTELIGRFMKTSSPKVRKRNTLVLQYLLLLLLYPYHTCSLPTCFEAYVRGAWCIPRKQLATWCMYTVHNWLLLLLQGTFGVAW